MSTMYTDKITNFAGDGAVDFPDGLTVGGAGFKWQKKSLESGVVGNGTLFEFNNLEVGKTYRFSFNIASTPTVDSVGFNILSGATSIHQFITNSVSEQQWKSGYLIFTAVDATLTMSTFSAATIEHGGSFGGVPTSWAILEELPIHTETSDWT